MTEQRLASTERRDLLASLLSIDDRIQVETARDGYLSARGAGYGVRFFHYPYPRLQRGERFAGVEIASLPDLGLMKLAAVIGRGARHDFVDLFLLCRKVPLAELLDQAPGKFPHVRDFPLQALKGLADRHLASDDPMPELLEPVDWAAVETWADDAVRRLGRRRIGFEPANER